MLPGYDYFRDTNLAQPPQNTTYNPNSTDTQYHQNLVLTPPPIHLLGVGPVQPSQFQAYNPYYPEYQEASALTLPCENEDILSTNLSQQAYIHTSSF